MHMTYRYLETLLRNQFIIINTYVLRSTWDLVAMQYNQLMSEYRLFQLSELSAWLRVQNLLIYCKKKWMAIGSSLQIIMELTAMILIIVCKPCLHGQIFFEKSHLSNVLWPCILAIFDQFILTNAWNQKAGWFAFEQMHLTSGKFQSVHAGTIMIALVQCSSCYENICSSNFSHSQTSP
jgi:hypothetical protein